jgi:hypothetical protein
MTTAAEYLDYARECLEWAAKAATEDEREACLAMARRWTEAALALEGAITPQPPTADKSPPTDARH